MSGLSRALRVRAVDPDARDAGVSLAELLAYMVLSGIVLAVVGTLLVRSLVVQRDVTDQTQAAGNAQVVVDDMEHALRNAVSVQVPSAFDGNLLIMKTRVGDDDAQASSFICRGWFLDTSTGVIKTVSGAPGSSAPTRNLTPTSSFAAWTTQISGVRRAGPAGSPYPAFAAEGTTGAQIRFEVIDGKDGSSTTLTTAAVPRPQGTSTGASACF